MIRGIPGTRYQYITGRDKMKKCETCKHYSSLIVVPLEFGECWYCQKKHCIFCTHYGRYCKDYEHGENDGGRFSDEYDNEELED